MTTLEQLSTDQNTQQNIKEEVMSNTSVSVGFSEVQKKVKNKNISLAVECIASILVVLTGIAVFKFTGLYDGVNSTIGKIVIGTVISCCYLAVFRHAKYRDR